MELKFFFSSPNKSIFNQHKYNCSLCWSFLVRIYPSMDMDSASSVVLQALTQATSQDTAVLKPAEEQLRQWETQPGFYSVLLVRRDLKKAYCIECDWSMETLYHKAPISLFHHCLLMEADYSLNFDSLLALRDTKTALVVLFCVFMCHVSLYLEKCHQACHGIRYSESTKGMVEVTCLLNSVLDKNISHTDCKTL